MTTPKSLFSKPFAKGGWSSLERPQFSPGLLLEDEDLNLGVEYTHKMMRLMLRSLFGCGVICGLKVTAVPTCKEKKRRIDVAKGVAISCSGDLIEVTESWSHEFGEDCDDGFPGEVWVVLCYKEKCCRPKDAGCSADEKTHSTHTRVRAGYEIQLHEKLPCACRCGNGPKLAGSATTTTSSDGCCDEAEEAVAVDTTGAEVRTPDPCSCYTNHVDGVCGCDCGGDCVVLGLVDPNDIVRKDEDGDDLASPIVRVYDEMVRRVRPLLNGWLKCRERSARKQIGAAEVRQIHTVQDLGDPLIAEKKPKPDLSGRKK